MADSTSLLAAINASQAISTTGNAINTAQANRAQGEYQNKIADLNARSQELQAQDAEKAGDAEALRRQRQGAETIAAQRAALAANGVDVGSGSALDIQKETQSITDADMQNIRTNAFREAFGYKSAANNTRGEGVFRRMAAENTARNTLITGGIEGAGYGLKSAARFKGGGTTGTRTTTNMGEL